MTVPRARLRNESENLPTPGADERSTPAPEATKTILGCVLEGLTCGDGKGDCTGCNECGTFFEAAAVGRSQASKLEIAREAAERGASAKDVLRILDATTAAGDASPPAAADAPGGADLSSPKSEAPPGAEVMWLRVAAFDALDSGRYSQVIQLAAVLLAKDREAPR